MLYSFQFDCTILYGLVPIYSFAVIQKSSQSLSRFRFLSPRCLVAINLGQVKHGTMLLSCGDGIKFKDSMPLSRSLARPTFVTRKTSYPAKFQQASDLCSYLLLWRLDQPSICSYQYNEKQKIQLYLGVDWPNLNYLSE